MENLKNANQIENCCNKIKKIYKINTLLYNQSGLAFCKQKFLVGDKKFLYVQIDSSFEYDVKQSKLGD